MKGRPICIHCRKLMSTPMVSRMRLRPVGVVVVPMMVPRPPMVAA